MPKAGIKIFLSGQASNAIWLRCYSQYCLYHHNTERQQQEKQNELFYKQKKTKSFLHHISFTIPFLPGIVYRKAISSESSSTVVILNAKAEAEKARAIISSFGLT